MTPPRTIGLPRMMKEKGEKRVFLPEFVQYLVSLGAIVMIEEGYGARSGYTFDAYRQGSEQVRECTRDEAFSQEVVLTLRSPTLEELAMIPSGVCLIAMLHYPTRPTRVAVLQEHGVNAISLDSIVDDRNLRLVENMKAVAWNGLEVSFDVLEGVWSGLQRPDGGPIKALVLGAGMVGKHAVEAATKLGNVERHNQYMSEGTGAAMAWTIGRSISGRPELMEKLLSEVDILVDATQRKNPSRAVIPNDWLAWLPEHAVLADLAVDPYLLDDDPPTVRGIEGIPHGDLDQYIFAADDPDWDETVPESVPSENRRTTVSCYSWPGIHPQACMAHYARQLEPLIRKLFEKGYDNLNPQGGYFERALQRATLTEWLRSGHYSPRPR